MSGYLCRVALLLLIVLALPILVIRAQPYHDYVTAGLTQAPCAAPCIMGIRPGTTSMSQAYYVLAAHTWVASTPDDFPSLIREASQIGAWVPRTVVHWHWSADHPAWIDGTAQGAITMENSDVLSIDIQTTFLLGDIILALGPPDALLVAVPSTGRYLASIGSYVDKGLEIQFEGFCPLRRSYELPVRIRFKPIVQHANEPAPLTAVCE